MIAIFQNPAHLLTMSAIHFDGVVPDAVSVILPATDSSRKSAALPTGLLTDRGTEFSDPTAIETNPMTGETDCRVFYCDPLQSNQKSECERNHELIRYIFPKGHSLNRFDQEKVTLAMNHINSTPREKWAMQVPIVMFSDLYGPQVVQKLGLVKIKFEFILLRPELVK